MQDRNAEIERRLLELRLEEWAVSGQAKFRPEVEGRLRGMLTASLSPVKLAVARQAGGTVSAAVCRVCDWIDGDAG